MPIYTLGDASMPTTDANVVSRDAVDQLREAAAGGVVSPAMVQSMAASSASLGEHLAMQINQPAPARGGALNPDVFNAPQQRTYVSGCGVPIGRPVVPGTGFAPSQGDDLSVLQTPRPKRNIGLWVLGAAAVAAVLAASR